MLKRTILACAASLALVIGSTAVSAQCRALSPGVACAGLVSSRIHADFRAPKPAPRKPITSVNPLPVEIKGSSPVDCPMVKPIDPQFRSSMPIVRPDPNGKLTMRVISVPGCASQAR